MYFCEMPVDTVTFDVWNTLLVHEFYDDRVRDARISRIFDAIRRERRECTLEDVSRAYDHSEKCIAAVWKEEKDLDVGEHIRIFLDGLGKPDDTGLVDTLREPYADALLDFAPVPVPGAVTLLERLKSKGYRLGIISNTGRTPGETMRKILDDLGMLGYFDSMIFSNEAGYIKPNRKIFDISLETLDAKPEKSVHVGDSMLLDVYGAKSAGMKAILFTMYSARFEQYMKKYYSANGRHASPDVVVETLDGVDGALLRL